MYVIERLNHPDEMYEENCFYERESDIIPII